MSREQFNYLEEPEQLEIVNRSGAFLDKRRLGGITIYLYQLDSFYVELYVNSYYDMLQGLKSFKGTKVLDPYLEKIDVRELISMES